MLSILVVYSQSFCPVKLAFLLFIYLTTTRTFSTYLKKPHNHFWLKTRILDNQVIRDNRIQVVECVVHKKP